MVRVPFSASAGIRTADDTAQAPPESQEPESQHRGPAGQGASEAPREPGASEAPEEAPEEEEVTARRWLEFEGVGMLSLRFRPSPAQFWACNGVVRTSGVVGDSSPVGSFSESALLPFSLIFCPQFMSPGVKSGFYTPHKTLFVTIERVQRIFGPGGQKTTASRVQVAAEKKSYRRARGAAPERRYMPSARKESLNGSRGASKPAAIAPTHCGGHVVTAVRALRSEFQGGIPSR